MSDDETTADIIAEMRRGTRLPGYWRSCDINAILQYHADRLEAAHRRERGDAAKLREALEAIISGYENADLCDTNYGEWCHEPANPCVNVSLCKAIHESRVDLSAPPRNCDVGTAQEQDERFHRFCVKHHTGSCAGCHNPVGDYTVANGVRECALVWAQMPYEEGGAK